ncbi:hypothetical protein [Lentilactobacillus senioris]|uniref:Uncharacterized protein n=1 Tax=Lentilactobacillus senioris DSM 24302 = JCM 17472 TaxID=1423802 RepID=A0A0R2CNT2_9LACO|nr:hypothetical protein [Lentilactobacillus senioris]KRM93357.1 hypothetical protein FC56_GL001024 [Lentilactobacillus senioris DSM 24302 = JCM 17472]
MAEKNAFQQLDEAATISAVKEFIVAYLKHYQNNTLEIFAQYSVDYWMSDINEFIAENSAYQPEELRKLLLKEYQPAFTQILTKINPDYTAEGQLAVGTWDEWYHEHAMSLEQGQ